ncbi:MAG: OmpA family protein [Plesiomonas sp.]
MIIINKPCLIIGLAFLLSAPSALAYSNNEKSSDTLDAPFYIGARLGWAHAHEVCSEDYNRCDNEELGWGVYSGYQLKPWLAFELGYTRYGKPDAAYWNGDYQVSAKINSIDASVLFSYALSSQWDIYTRLGVVRESIDKRYGLTQQQTELSYQGLGFVVGGGVKYTLAPSWSLRAEMQFNDGMGDGTVLKTDHYFSAIGLTYHFGLREKEPSAVLVQEQRTLVQQPTLLNQAIVLKPVLFAHDSYTLKPSPELQAAADNIRMQKINVNVEGHTDSTGSKQYNQKLSERRAQAVADFLKQQISDETRIKAVGYGESQPIMSNKTKDGRAQNRRVELSFPNIPVAQ